MEVPLTDFSLEDVLFLFFTLLLFPVLSLVLVLPILNRPPLVLFDFAPFLLLDRGELSTECAGLVVLICSMLGEWLGAVATWSELSASKLLDRVCRGPGAAESKFGDAGVGVAEGVVEGGE